MNKAHNVNQVRACHTEIGQMSSKRESENKVIFLSFRLFISAWASCTTSGQPVRPYALKILTPIYRHICHMNHQKTPQTNPMAQWDPLDVSLHPLGPPGPPIAPLGPLKRSLGLIEL